MVDIEKVRGKAMGAAADFWVDVKKEAGGAQEQLAETRGKAKAATFELSSTSIALAVAGVVVVLALVATWSRAARQANARRRRRWWKAALRSKPSWRLSRRGP